MSRLTIVFALILCCLWQLAMCELKLSKKLAAEKSDSCDAFLVDSDPKKILCVCSADSCKQLTFSWPQKRGQIMLVTSSQSGRRFKKRSLLNFYAEEVDENFADIFLDDFIGSANAPTSVKVEVDLREEFQPILGWGCSFTDSASINVQSLSSERAEQLMQSYFGDAGLQYTFGRVPIAGTDFSTRPYTYDDTPDDFELKNWSLTEEDTEFKIPLIKRATELTEQATSFKDNLKLFASPWSPPVWMKTNRDIVKGHLIDEPKVYKSYAEYLMKFYDAYKENGINFWGATIQNEPYLSDMPSLVYDFNSLQFGSDQMIKFVAEYLGPALESRNMTKANGFNLMVGDDSLGLINAHVPSIMSSPEVRKYVSGLAFHWYLSGSTPVSSYDKLSELYEMIKDDIQFVMMSEARNGREPTTIKKVDPGSWSRGERYASDIIQDLNRQTGAWIDWNLALSESGGPHWSGSALDSAILVDPIKDEFYKQPMYYVLAHFSRLFQPGSIRVGSEVTPDNGSLLVAAVHNKKTGHVVVNILNLATKPKIIEFVAKSSTIEIDLPKPITVEAKSFTSVVVKL